MFNGGLTRREEILYKMLKENDCASIDDMVDAVLGINPRASRKSVTVTLRYLGSKIAVLGEAIVNNNSLGVGRKGNYSIVKSSDCKNVKTSTYL